MRRKRRYLISAGILVACVCVALGVLAMLPPRPGVTKANFDRIEKGMTMATVNEVFGKEPLLLGGIAFGTLHNCYARETWFHENGASATLWFHNDSVTDTRWRDSTESITDKLRRWLHLPK